MRFVLDQDVFASTARILNGLGHDAVPVARIGLSQAEDSDLLKVAREQNRILVSRDRDFGGLVFAQDLGAGVIYLRMLPSTQNAVHRELERILAEHSESDLKQAFVVVEPGRHRFRKLKKHQIGTFPCHPSGRPSRAAFVILQEASQARHPGERTSPTG